MSDTREDRERFLRGLHARLYGEDRALDDPRVMAAALGAVNECAGLDDMQLVGTYEQARSGADLNFEDADAVEVLLPILERELALRGIKVAIGEDGTAVLGMANWVLDGELRTGAIRALAEGA